MPPETKFVPSAYRTTSFFFFGDEETPGRTTTLAAEAGAKADGGAGLLLRPRAGDLEAFDGAGDLEAFDGAGLLLRPRAGVVADTAAAEALFPGVERRAMGIPSETDRQRR